MVRAGLCRIGGKVMENPFLEVEPEGLEFELDGEQWRYHAKAYLMMHKPAGHECSHKPQHHSSVYSLLPEPLVTRGVQSIGRLDYDTTGLLLFSDDGKFIHFWSSGKKRIPKTYEIVTRHAIDEGMLASLRNGVQLHDEPGPIRAAACDQIGEQTLRMVVTEGKYHQVKRMIAAVGNRVEHLHRSQVGGLSLPDDMPVGYWRWLSADDIEALASFEPYAR